MLEKINEFKSWVQVIVSAIVGVTAGFLVYLFRSRTTETAVLWIVVSIVFVVFTQKVFEFLAKKLINNSVMLRRFLLGKDFVEGTWAEKAILCENGRKRLYGLALLQIRFLDKDYIVSGKVFDLDFKYIGNFQSQATHYFNSKLTYYFEGTSLHQEESFGVGRGELTFDHPDGAYPVTMAGHLLETRNHDKVNVEGWKLAPESYQGIKLDDKQAVGEFLRTIFGDEPEL